MWPTVINGRRIAGVIGVQRSRNVYVRYLQVHRPQLHVSLSRVEDEGINLVRLHHCW
jgi:hypothetical protein